MLKVWFEIPLWQRVLAGLLAGLAAGIILGENARSIQWIGDIFIRSIRMLVVPLIFTTLVAGVVSMGNAGKLGSIGLKAFILYLGTTALAITIGLVAGTLLQPGTGVELPAAAAAAAPAGPDITLSERMLSIIPPNPVAAMVEGNILAIILFAILVGTGIIMAGDEAVVLRDFFRAGSEVMLKLTFIVMELAPFGVFALIAYVAGTQGPQTLLKVLMLAVTVYLACFIHIAVVHFGMVKFLARLRVLPFIRGAVDPQLLAYSTSSSAATLPATMAAADRNMGIRTPVRASVLPLGATVNMDGTALYVGIVTLFAVQAFGISLTPADYFIIALTTTLVSIGTASVPSASLFLLAAVLGSVGVSPAQTAIIVGFILPFDRILDMMRTVVNVTGDLAVATVVAKSEGELDEKTYNAGPQL